MHTIKHAHEKHPLLAYGMAIPIRINKRFHYSMCLPADELLLSPLPYR
jgi:hypothetical protein